MKVHHNSKRDRFFKYLIIGLVVYVSSMTIPANGFEPRGALIVAMLASITFALLEMYSPCVIIKR